MYQSRASLFVLMMYEKFLFADKNFYCSQAGLLIFASS